MYSDDIFYEPDSESQGISAIPVDDGVNTPDPYSDLVNPQGVGNSLPTWESIRSNNLNTSVTFDDKTWTMVYRAATIPPIGQIQQALNETRKDWGEVKFIRLQVRRGELAARNSVIGLIRAGFRQIDSLPGFAQFEKDMSRRPARKRISTKPEPAPLKPVVPEFTLTISEFQTKQAALEQLRARIKTMEEQHENSRPTHL
jgi:hypothetical protein